jgi:hypothetical protein
MIFWVIQPDGISEKKQSLSGFEAMQIAVSLECRNDNGQNSTKKYFHWSTMKVYIQNFNFY